MQPRLILVPVTTMCVPSLAAFCTFALKFKPNDGAIAKGEAARYMGEGIAILELEKLTAAAGHS